MYEYRHQAGWWCVYHILYVASPSGGPRCCCDNCAKNCLPCCRRLRRRYCTLCCCCCCRCCCCCYAAVELLLCWCCCHIRIPLFRVPKKRLCCTSWCQPIFPFSFFRYEISIFVIWWNSAIRSSSTVKTMPEWVWPFTSSIELLVEILLSQTLYSKNIYTFPCVLKHWYSGV